MNRRKNLLFIISCLTTAIAGLAQDKIPVKFGKLTPQDFNVRPGGPDSAADAVIVADFGTSEFEGNIKGWFTLVFKRSVRIKIINRKGFDAATVTIPLFVDGLDAEKLVSLKASTYNLEDGKVVETKLEDKAIFTNQESKHRVNKKFTFPALKEGSILEYSFTQESPFLFNLQPWAFQGDYPCLWSEYQVDMPRFFQYVTLTQGYLAYHINKSDSRNVTFHMTSPGVTSRDERYTFDDEVVMHRWVMKDVPALKEEPFTTTLANYISRIEFQLVRYQFPSGYTEDKMGSWAKLNETLLKTDDFGGGLDDNNGWLDQDFPTIIKGAGNSLEKAQKIYAYVRDNFGCTAHSGLSIASGSLKTVYKNKSGNEAELNLLLIAMLRHAKIGADPVILSTRAHGFTLPMYPLIDRFNYVICLLTIDSSQLFLDASEPWLGFGRIPSRCYNGSARVVARDAGAEAVIDADDLREKKLTTVFISRSDDGKGLIGHFDCKPGFNEADIIRQKVREKGLPEFTKAIEGAYTGDMTCANLRLDSLKQPEQPLELGYDLKFSPDAATDVIYFNPMLSEGYKENPFKAAERFYPVEMPYAMDETYILNMELPEGYEVDELPKPARVSYNGDEGMFEYLIQKDESRIQFRARLILAKANYKREDYGSLRDFFSFVVKKEGEQIVFKKKKS
ncbi:MAG: DUF3857 domain-containing protein [Bacteroidetes bacterium]|nr:DUF3857 domain-containing protein [Bacteroidota bacterium]